MTRTPTGAVHEVPVDDLFFSTTDAKGVIDEANEVFTRNARFSREQLLAGEPGISGEDLVGLVDDALGVCRREEQVVDGDLVDRAGGRARHRHLGESGGRGV